MNDYCRRLLDVARTVQAEVDEHFLPPAEIARRAKDNVLPYSHFQGTRGYLEKLVFQINATYEQTCYDACAVVIRRLVEILVIEAFEYQGIEDRIKDENGNFVRLEELINMAISETVWNLSRNTKRGLRNLKGIGDLSAHGRRYNAHRSDIDKIANDLRVTTEEFLYLAGLRK